MIELISGNLPLMAQVQPNNMPMMDNSTIQTTTMLQGVTCYTDASTAPDNSSLAPTKAGIGVFFINTQVQPVQYIFIKAQLSASTSVMMAEAQLWRWQL